MLTVPYQTRLPLDTLPSRDFSDSIFELYLRIDPVVIIHGNRPHQAAVEHNHGGRLLRDLHRFGLEGVPIRGVFSRNGALTIPSVRALNCYLRHCGGLSRFMASRGPAWHRFAWDDLQRLLSLRWTN